MANKRCNSIKFSIVLPIYNVEKYLNRCVDSIYAQRYENFELILVDDGSPDNCPRKCDEWANKDPRIKVVHKKNEGLGMARNSGLEIATGEYIAFFDSDDYIVEDLFYDAAEYLSKEKVDLLEFGHHHIDSKGNVSVSYPIRMDHTLYKGEDVYNTFWPELISTDPDTGFESGLLMSAWCCFYRLDTLKQSEFSFVSERKLICEDVYSLMRLMPAIKSVGILPTSYYCYCENDSSLTRTYREDRFEKIVYFQEQLELLCSDEVYTDEIRKRIYRPFLDNVLACIKMEAQQVKRLGRIRIINNIRTICKNPITKKALNVISNVSFSFPRKMLHFLIWHEKGLLIYMMLKGREWLENK